MQAMRSVRLLLAWSVCLSVCESVCVCHMGKKAERIEMPFGEVGQSRVGQATMY